jgi:LAGLIDADG endonuclease
MATGLILDPFVYIIIFLYISANFYLASTMDRGNNETGKLNRFNLNVSTFNDKDSSHNINPYWITGFSDGESSFVLRLYKTKKRKVGWCVNPIFSLELHIRDLYVLEKIQSYFKIGSIIKRKTRKTVVYAVQSVNALNNIIIPHFTKYPLLTEKQKDFRLFCLGIDVINKKEHLILDGLNKIRSIRSSMNKKSLGNSNKYFNVPTLINTIGNINKVILDPYWLVGFVDAEGCFYIKPIKSKSEFKLDNYSLVFTISQHSRDLLLLSNIIDYLQCGIIEIPKDRHEVRYIVYKFNDHFEKIILFFEKYNLVTFKRLDYLDYKKAASILNKKNLLTEEDLLNIQLIKSRMNKNRFNF